MIVYVECGGRDGEHYNSFDQNTNKRHAADRRTGRVTLAVVVEVLNVGS